MTAGTILIVDDEKRFAGQLARILSAEGFTVKVAHSCADARSQMPAVQPDVVLLDLQLPDGGGQALMGELKEEYPLVDFIIITAFGTIQSAVAATRLGAFDYLTKPFEPEELLFSLRRAFEKRSLNDELRLLRTGSQGCGTGIPPGVETRCRSRAMRETYRLARIAARQDGTVLLLGESGTGKDCLARWIHANSPRSDAPFFVINCAAVPKDLAESELFGHEPGSFTGTKGRKKGMVELADKGTLVLNEIGELESALQAKLLMFLDTQSFVRVGGESTVRIDARIIAATNRDIEQDVAQGRFRRDLYYRINVFPISLPPLRERRGDLPVLVDEILAQLTDQMRLRKKPRVDESAMRIFEGYDWPGNIRELVNALERAIMLSGGEEVAEGAVAFLGQSRPQESQAANLPLSMNLREATDDLARSLIRAALQRANGRRKEAADLLGISRHALTYQMKVLKIEE